jgi:hypothetical protein
MLRLTGLEMELCFKPAIENFVNKDYDTIYIDTATFLDKDKKRMLTFRNVAKRWIERLLSS